MGTLAPHRRFGSQTGSAGRQPRRAAGVAAGQGLAASRRRGGRGGSFDKVSWWRSATAAAVCMAAAWSTTTLTACRKLAGRHSDEDRHRPSVPRLRCAHHARQFGHGRAMRTLAVRSESSHSESPMDLRESLIAARAAARRLAELTGPERSRLLADFAAALARPEARQAVLAANARDMASCARRGSRRSPRLVLSSDSCSTTRSSTPPSTASGSSRTCRSWWAAR